MKTHPLHLVAVAMLLLAGTAFARSPRAELAGLRLGMTEEAVHEKLRSAGTLMPESRLEKEREEQQSWKLSHGPYGFLALGYDDERVAWITAFVREDGPPIRYADVGPLDSCERPGNFQCVWKVAGAKHREPYWVIARGRDSVRVASISLMRPRGAKAPETEANEKH